MVAKELCWAVLLLHWESRHRSSFGSMGGRSEPRVRIARVMLSISKWRTFVTAYRYAIETACSGHALVNFRSPWEVGS
jgi:hypothetical protein